MSSSPKSASNHGQTTPSQDANPPTVASFSPVTLSHASAATKQRSTILVHQKSPLLVATPPQITRALAYSHPFLLPLNKLVGLLSWTSGDPWESFLLVVTFWAVVLYGDMITRWAGPVVVAIWLIVGMYSRRYSPLSSVGWTGEKVKKSKKGKDTDEESEGSARHQKSLDEIVDTLKTFTSRCNVLLEPFLLMTDFLSTQKTATSATTRPALTTLFVRILLVTPVWIILTLPPLQIITTRRTILTTGTLILSWHSRPARISRTILWRFKLVRRLCSLTTGLEFGDPKSPPSPTPKGTAVPPPLPPRPRNGNTVGASLGTKHRPGSPGVRFTFILFENQRRWLGLGWTFSLFAYERAPWTDEHLNPAPPKDQFTLPEVENGAARWRWVEGSDWRVEGAAPGEEGGGKERNSHKSSGRGPGDNGWIYYDNKWRDGRRGQDSWGRYTRRRKWYRDAELVEVTSSTEITPSITPSPSSTNLLQNAKLASESTASDVSANRSESVKDDGEDTASTTSRKRRWFRRSSRTSAGGNSLHSVEAEPSRDDGEEDHPSIRNHHHDERDGDWGLGDDARMGLG
ncbi:MAG: peroxisome- protein [Sclerophora amabilis]|nr:MAG: peroxisome- protein [Sclerophora amabilis]